MRECVSGSRYCAWPTLVSRMQVVAKSLTAPFLMIVSLTKEACTARNMKSAGRRRCLF